jgi:CBS-domain-containing membrane protein
MAHHGVRVDPGLSTEALVAMLLERELEAVPVVDAAGAFVGMVSMSDALRDFQDRDQVEEQVAAPQIGEGGFHVVSLAPSTVREIMLPSTLELMDTDRFARAVILMAYCGKSHLPVACSKCGGICVISALDVASWLARRGQGRAPETSAPGGSARRKQFARN